MGQTARPNPSFAGTVSMLRAVDRVATHFLWVAQMMIVVGIIITIGYAFDRDPPFRVILVLCWRQGPTVVQRSTCRQQDQGKTVNGRTDVTSIGHSRCKALPR